jgi:hypothetical protein
MKDVGADFCRYTVNHDGPGRPWTDARSPDPTSRNLLADSGRVRAVQKDGVVLAVYRATSQFLDRYTALRLTVVLRASHRELKRVEHTAEPDIVWIEDDYFYVALRSMILTNRGRKQAVRVERDSGYARPVHQLRRPGATLHPQGAAGDL